MPNKKKLTKAQENFRMIAIVAGGILAFLIAVFMNIIGIKQTLDSNETNKSGIIGFSFPSNEPEEKREEKEKNSTIEEKDAMINSILLTKLKNSNWDRITANLKNFTLDENGNAYFEDGTSLYCTGKNVDYVIFDERYQEEIVKHIKFRRFF